MEMNALETVIETAPAMISSLEKAVTRKEALYVAAGVVGAIVLWKTGKYAYKKICNKMAESAIKEALSTNPQ